MVSKRTDVRAYARAAHTGDSMYASGTRTHTDYYATFEVESGDRMELAVASDEFGYLAEGDMGTLTFQGTDFLGFARG